LVIGASRCLLKVSVRSMMPEQSQQMPKVDCRLPCVTS
jgi:hypothetical protein